MQKLFENWRGYLKENEDQSVPEYLFPNARQDMLKAYEEGGVNRQIFINKIEREIMPILASTGAGGPLSSAGIYEKFIFPQILKTIQETPVQLVGEFPCGKKEQDLAMSQMRGPRKHSDPKGKPNFPNAWHSRAGDDLGAGESNIYIGCRYLSTKKGDFDNTYDQKGHKAYDVFRHEMGHAIDTTTVYPKLKWLRNPKNLGSKSLEKWFNRAAKRKRTSARGMGRNQKKIIGFLFPVTASRKKRKKHSERRVEIYTNIIDLRSRLGRPYQAEDIAKLKSDYEGLKSIVGLHPGTSRQGLMDLRIALTRYVNKNLTDQQIADLLNRVAAADKIKKPSYMQQTSLAENKLIISLKK